MKTLKCRDMGSMDCDFVATAETGEEAKKLMYEHAAQVHPDVMTKMTPEQKEAANKKMDELLE